MKCAASSALFFVALATLHLVCSVQAGPFDGSPFQGLLKSKKQTLNVVLISDKENTVFRVKFQGETNFHTVGTGKFITNVPMPEDKPVEVSAKPPGYREKVYTVQSPNKQFQFYFLIEDKVLTIRSDRPNTHYRIRKADTPNARWQPIKESGSEIEYAVAHTGNFEIEAQPEKCAPQILPVLDPTGELEFSNFTETGGLELRSNIEFTRFLFRDLNQGTTNWEYLGVGKSLSIKVPVAAGFEIKAQPFHYREKVETVGQPKEKVEFNFTDDDKEDAHEAVQPAPMRPPIVARPLDLVAELPTAQVASIKNSEGWRAVLVGISDYSSAGTNLPNLKTPKDDVLELKALLEKSYGFRSVTVLLDGEATLDRIRNELLKVDTACGVDDNILFYYAGHGSLEGGKFGYWVCADGRQLAHSEITDFIRRFRSRRVLLVSDSCFSGEFLTRDTGKRAFSTVPTKEQAVEESQQIVATKQPARQVLTSGLLEAVSDRGTGACEKHSPFACQMLSDLQSVKVGSVVSVTDLYAHMTQTWRQQHPEAEMPQRGHLLGDGGGEFYFVRFE